MARLPGFRLTWIWYVSVIAVALQVLLSLWLLRREMDRRLKAEPVAETVAPPMVVTAPE
jgi:hypothetical protein